LGSLWYDILVINGEGYSKQKLRVTICGTPLSIVTKKEGASMGDKNPKKAPKQKKAAGKPSVAPVIHAEPEVVKKAKPTK
jgi:hypothetical protein